MEKHVLVNLCLQMICYDKAEWKHTDSPVKKIF